MLKDRSNDKIDRLQAQMKALDAGIMGNAIMHNESPADWADAFISSGILSLCLTDDSMIKAHEAMINSGFYHRLTDQIIEDAAAKISAEIKRLSSSN